ncbi:MAG: type II secretion system secretin GspD [Rhodoferax sp.]|nr:type II secretion system secretin GspD [Rhodoferax sp.]
MSASTAEAYFFGHTRARPRFQFAIVSIAVCAILLGATAPLYAQSTGKAPAQQAKSSSRAGGPVTLNFANADIEAVARTMAVITGKNVVVDPRVKGTMTLITTNPVTPAMALRQFSTQLRTQGFALVESAGLYLVVPEADAKLQSGTVSAGAPPPASGQIITQIFKLNYETANNLVPVLRPLISPNNTINVNPGNNSLIVTDYADNLRRIGTIIAALDVANATGVEIIRLQHAIATDLVPIVSRLIESGGAGGPALAGQGDSTVRTTLVAEPRSNSLILRAANPARLALVRTLVEKLDQASSINSSMPGSRNPALGNIYVVYLKNADASKLAVTLRAAMAASASGGSVGGGGSITSPASNGISPPAGVGGIGGGIGGGNTGGGIVSAAATSSLAGNEPSTGGQIQADPATNSLIITAVEPQYRQLRAVIDRLDSRRAQVYIESLIVEVNSDKAAEFGIQFQTLLGNRSAIGTNFATGGANIISLAAGIANRTAGTVPSTGINFGAVNGNGVLGLLARFLETTGDGNILSTPNLLTLDNEEARIVIGQNVPFPTGSYTNTGGGNNGSVNPFTTVERKDVGLTLRVKPQISEDGSVKMQIFQEISNVQASTVGNVNGPTTNKRSIESNVVVGDGSIVVLGGLLQDEFSGSQEKVPVVGDIPVFGNLFKAETRRRQKTNLMVFLRPVVVRDAVSTENLSLDRYELMRGAQKQAQPVPSILVPINESAIAPPLPRPEKPSTAPLMMPSTDH